MTSDDLLAAAVGELYSADPEGFTERRAELIARARSAGQAAVARQIAALRKPTRSAWVINQLARTDPGAVSRLAALGQELRDAERSRDGGRMRELSQARRQLIAALLRQALAASGQQSAPAAMREDITATLAAALADPEVAAQIQQGTLLRPARRTGFGTAQGPELALVPPAGARQAVGRPGAGPARAKTGRPKAERTRTETERARAEADAQAEPGRQGRAETERARAKADAQAERDREARAEAERARAETERARAEAEAQAERDRRAQARAEAERVLAKAEQAVRTARTAEEELTGTVRRLEHQLNELRGQLQDARTEARQAVIAARKARQVLGRLPQ